MKFISKILLKKALDIISKESVFETNEIFNNFKHIVDWMLSDANRHLIDDIISINEITKNKFSIFERDKLKEAVILYLLNSKNWKRESKAKHDTHYKGELDSYAFNEYDYYWINKAIDIDSFKVGDKVIRRAFILKDEILNRYIEFVIVTNESDTEIINFGTVED